MRPWAPALLFLLLAACSQKEPQARVAERDPAIVQALADQIMVDPDLANQNEGNAALRVPSDHALPLPNMGPEEAAAARAEAAVLVGGADMLVAPATPTVLQPPKDEAFVTPAQFVAKVPGAAGCAARLSYSAAWAARLPAALPIYPRGATIEAAGLDAPDCVLRIVRYVSPAAPDDLLAFYAALAREARFSVEHRAGPTAHVLNGRRGKAAFRMELKVSGDGLSEVTLATVGV